MRAAVDFALCVRPTRSCSRHGDCARAQFATLNQDRQSFVWPTDTGNACPLFYDYAPFRKLAAAGGGIADYLATDGSGVNRETPPEDRLQDAHGVAENRAQFAGPSTGKYAAGSGEPGVACDSGRHMPVLAGENFGAAATASSGGSQALHTDAPAETQAAAPTTSAVGLDTAAAFGVCSEGTAGDGPSSSPDCHR